MSSKDRLPAELARRWVLSDARLAKARAELELASAAHDELMVEIELACDLDLVAGDKIDRPNRKIIRAPKTNGAAGPTPPQKES